MEGYEGLPDELREIAEVARHQPEWKQAQKDMLALDHAGADKETIYQAGIARLKEMGIDGETLLSPMRDGLLAGVPEKDYQAAIMAIDLSNIASMVSEIETGEPLHLAGPLGADVRTLVLENEEGPYTVTPLTNPEETVARLLQTCYRVYPKEVFSRPENAMHDAEWFGRHAAGETYRQIALSDERSGLSPEARVSPEEYPAEVKSKTDTVGRAVRRYRKRWTQKGESVSANSD